MTQASPTTLALQIDIVSDVMCPWCIVGYRQLEQALAALNIGAFIRWHPFELNPQMGPEGQNLVEHIAEKYGASPEQSAQNRAHLTQIGSQLGIDFQFDAESRIVNSFAAHQLLDWAQDQNLQHPLKLALFEAHFTAGLDVSDPKVLVDVAAQVGLDRDEARQVLDGKSHVERVRERQSVWTSQGISGVPSMVFAGKYLVTGAQGVDNYVQILEKVVKEMSAA
ncbi:DsbA family oxidoreductase [Sulfitobacter sp. BSw21498]|uniref:DsbA family oxidoreductase n=1 Tax=Sulfitobacter sp. BSw21498 TaxID=664426 RepID=UPI001110A2DC|nr:DsbA family oxidoreductase [Sulfitobacter sp. BSw21498]